MGADEIGVVSDGAKVTGVCGAATALSARTGICGPGLELDKKPGVDELRILVLGAGRSFHRAPGQG
jgi:hypothetical protein